MEDLLKGDEPNLKPPGMNQDVTRDITTTGTVRLLQAVQVPAKHERLVRGKVGDWNQKDLSLFTRSIDEMADAAVEKAV